ncbi:MAG: hypothetical protein AAFQ43_08095, partial [Bacteroidota bacterium]
VARGVAVGGLTFAGDVLDVGAVAPGEAVQGAIRFQHTGDRPIRILEVRAPEGVEVVAPTRPLFSGDVRAVMMTIADPGALARGGALHVPVDVVTDQEGSAVVTLRVVGEIVASGG